MTQQHLTTKRVRVDSLTPDPENVRTHDTRNLESIRKSLEQFGQRKPLVVAKANNGSLVVIAGNGTLAAAKLLGWSEIVVTQVPDDWDPDRARAYAIADNRTAELADWDKVKLASALLDLEAVGFESTDLGFMPVGDEVDPYAEWEAMPEFEQDDRTAAFRVTVNFPTEADADKFFELIDRPKKAKMWWPTDDGLVGSSVRHRYVAEEE